MVSVEQDDQDAKISHDTGGADLAGLLRHGCGADCKLRTAGVSRRRERAKAGKLQIGSGMVAHELVPRSGLVVATRCVCAVYLYGVCARIWGVFGACC